MGSILANGIFLAWNLIYNDVLDNEYKLQRIRCNASNSSSFY